MRHLHTGQMRALRGLQQLRWCSNTPATTGSTEVREQTREEYLREKWKPDEKWMYPGVNGPEDEITETADGQELISRHFGIFDGPQKGSYNDLVAEMPINYLKEPVPDWLTSKPLDEPMRNDALYEDTELPHELEVQDQKAWVLQRVVDKESWETALGEQLFRTTDLDKNSTELYPVGYGLAVNTCALVVEDDDAVERYYHICGGRSDHKMFMRGACLTMRVDAELFFHVLNYFGENYGLERKRQRYHHKYRGMCVWGNGMDEEDLEFMNGFFNICNLSMQVDEERLDEACEGHLPVVYHKRSTPNDPVWTPESTGIFIWQNFMMSVPKQLNKDPQHEKKWWYDPYTLRKQYDINARAFNGAADRTPENAHNFDVLWGEDGQRAQRIKASMKKTEQLGREDAIDILKPPGWGEGADNITDWFRHGTAHPIFTTKGGGRVQ